MGTRADFYVGRGAEAEWLGSIAWDGYPDGIELQDEEWPPGQRLFDATTEDQFRNRVAAFFNGRNDVTLPKDGWPWPWDDSSTTDYAYAFDGGKVWASGFGHSWFDATQSEPEDETPKDAVFPNMKDRANVTFGPRSGLLVIRG